ncbi:enoyl-CoA hydratase/isomerase family protein [Paraglaciecola psychrophila]|uniref:3-hydroxyisobutyryl-CoA hydrolase n=1 Tax=Paraglaciecola psychrophila 170 TaxID=1129794 RepID=K7ATJ2_9ALTE|nr:enoyl-CoA hydratase/isomerase family protein [Paraglaciecola psychrophila]AGH46724.1 Enoyl-CoA hydratase/isomerase [Paraglaciecola psychrophila 170]GAC38565.1 enoyl-CoA hydratase [Paraglaciecola psychrophila 170]
MFSENAPVIFDELTTENGFKIGHATLTKPASLNALDLPMINLLTPQLEKWQQDPKIAMVILDGSGERAFCAGGDIVSMYKSMQDWGAVKENPDANNSYALQNFFTQEYQLDHLIHMFSKPILVWGNGIIMGGGMGLMSGGSHRVVTETSRIAMPEISIGLYPDVGGSYFLNKMPAGCGLFLGLTGAFINAADAIYSNLADYFVPHDAQQTLFDRLLAANWQPDVLHQTLSSICDDFHTLHSEQLPQGNLIEYQDWFTSLATKTDASQAAEYIMSVNAEDNKWLSKAQKTLSAGSPITANLVFEQLLRGKDMTLAECFQMELGLSCKCGEFGEFQEGVRALLIEKDHQPNWRFKSVDQVPKDTIDYFFENIWSLNAHPLAHLGVN